MLIYTPARTLCSPIWQCSPPSLQNIPLWLNDFLSIPWSLAFSCCGNIRSAWNTLSLTLYLASSFVSPFTSTLKSHLLGYVPSSWCKPHCLRESLLRSSTFLYCFIISPGRSLCLFLIITASSAFTQRWAHARYSRRNWEQQWKKSVEWLSQGGKLAQILQFNFLN